MKIQGFTKIENVPVAKRIILAVDGLEKQGKTHFSLTAPGPIAYIDIDIGSEGVVEKFLTSKEVHRHAVQVPVALGGLVDVVECEKQWQDLKNAYQIALNAKGIKTIIFDTATEAWELLRLAKFGRLTQVMPYHYGPVNAEFRDVIRSAYTGDKNVILLHKLKPKYVNDKRTAEYERTGYSDTGFLVQANVRAYRDKESGEFCVRVTDCRQNCEIAGMPLQGPMCNFQMFACSVFPDSKPEDWE